MFLFYFLDDHSQKPSNENIFDQNSIIALNETTEQGHPKKKKRKKKSKKSVDSPNKLDDTTLFDLDATQAIEQASTSSESVENKFAFHDDINDVVDPSAFNLYNHDIEDSSTALLQQTIQEEDLDITIVIDEETTDKVNDNIEIICIEDDKSDSDVEIIETGCENVVLANVEQKTSVPNDVSISESRLVQFDVETIQSGQSGKFKPNMQY